MTAHLRLLLLALLLAPALRAQGLEKAMADFQAGRLQRAAIGFYQVEEQARGEQRAQAEYSLAQSLEKLDLGFSSFFWYGRIIDAGPSHPWYDQAIERAVAVTARFHDEVMGPNVLARAYNERFARLPPEVRARIDEWVALLAWRAGKYDEAEKFLERVPPGSAASPQARYLGGLLLQRKDPEAAVKAFRGILALEGPHDRDLDELTRLALGRTLYALHRYREAGAEYAALPRFSRHWDEALFEGAYADLRAGDPGAALGRLHSLHSPHLSDQFAPESLNLTAIIYHQHCLHPQAREALAEFDREYLPMKERLKAVLAAGLPLEAYGQLLQPGDRRLPEPVRQHLRKNERVESMVGYLARLDAEEQRVKRDEELAHSPLGTDLLDLIARQKALMAQVAGKFIQGRLADMAHLIELLEADRQIIGFETAKGEKEMLEASFDVRGQLAGQSLRRPPMPATGHEYWPFDGEYWPDEIGYYRYTLKDACPAKKEE